MTRLSLITQGALVGLALLGAACQGELKLLNDPGGLPTPVIPPDMEPPPPPPNEISFKAINIDMEQPAFGCTSPLKACHGTDMPVGLLKLQQNGPKDMGALMANYEETKKQVDMAAHKASKILKKPLATAADVMHQGGKSYFKNEMDPIYIRWLDWVRCGAKLEEVDPTTCPAATGGI